MMHDDTLRNIEYLREKADVSYEEAADLLDRYDGNVMRVLVELERQGRIYKNESATGTKPPNAQCKAEQKKPNEPSFLQKALSHRLVVENGSGEKKETIANLSAPFCAGATLVAPHLAIGSVALMFVLGYRIKLKKQPIGKLPGDVEEFVDRTVSNIKKTASSVQETVNEMKPGKDHSDDHHDDDDEGGEITIE